MKRPHDRLQHRHEKEHVKSRMSGLNNNGLNNSNGEMTEAQGTPLGASHRCAFFCRRAPPTIKKPRQRSVFLPTPGPFPAPIPDEVVAYEPLIERRDGDEVALRS